MKIHLGCGFNVVEGWVNVDGSWGVFLAKYPFLRKFLKLLRVFPEKNLSVPWSSATVFHDLRKKLPFSSSHVEMIYCAHTLEHLYLDEAKHLLEECFRILAPGGLLRVVVPDLKELVAQYMGGKPAENSSEIQKVPADLLMGGLLVRSSEAPKGNWIRRLYSAFNDFQSHKWMYDSESLKYHFELAGFVQIQAMSFRKSQIQDIAKLEQEIHALEGPEIYIEGIKPQ